MQAADQSTQSISFLSHSPTNHQLVERWVADYIFYLLKIITAMFFRRLALPVILFSIMALSAVNFLVLPTQVNAQQGSVQAPDLGLEFPRTAGLTEADPRILVANIVRAAMGLLGVVALVIILIAGLEWMTAGGNDEKVSAAKQMLKAGVIGLIIIMSAYSITSFVVSRLTNATTAGDAGVAP